MDFNSVFLCIFTLFLVHCSGSETISQRLRNWDVSVQVAKNRTLFYYYASKMMFQRLEKNFVQSKVKRSSIQAFQPTVSDPSLVLQTSTPPNKLQDITSNISDDLPDDLKDLIQ